MKKTLVFLVLIIMVGTGQSQAQILKGFGKKIEKKVEDKLEKKADRHTDKVIDKVDKETDKPLNSALEGKPSAASGSTSTASTPATRATESNPLSKEGMLAFSGNHCDDFIWFKSGAAMAFETFDGKGKSLHSTHMRIGSVTEEQGRTKAEVLTADDNGNEVSMVFVCEGENMYMDFSSFLQAAMEKAGQSGTEAETMQNVLNNTNINMDEGFMSFPKQMYPGQELETASITIESSPAPQITMYFSTTLKDRKVVAKEKVTTAAGTFECLKISGVRTTRMKAMGMNRELEQITEYLWFAPQVGVIQQEEYDSKGKLQTKMQLTKFSL